jgi:hypothetical protein
MTILGRKHPCNPTVGKIAQEFMNYTFFSGRTQPREEDMWWRELHSVTFPAGTVSNQSRGILQRQFNYILHIDEDSSRKSN